MHLPHESTLPTTVPGQSLQGWSVSGTALWYPGQADESPAIAEAARLNREAEARRREARKFNEKEIRDGSKEKSGGEGEAGMGRSGEGANREDSAESTARLVEMDPSPHHPDPAQEPQALSQAELAVTYRARIAFHIAAGMRNDLAVAAAVRDVKGYVPPVATKRRKVRS